MHLVKRAYNDEIEDTVKRTDYFTINMKSNAIGLKKVLGITKGQRGIIQKEILNIHLTDKSVRRDTIEKSL